MEIVFTHRIEERQFRSLMHLLTEWLTGDDPAKLAALTTRLKASEDALTATTTQAQP